MAHLFDPLKIRDITFRNRIMVSPMCQYSCVDGMATDWHLVHLGSRAVGGAALVCAEATAVEPRGRISPYDLGLWSDAHAAPLARVAHFIEEQGAVPAIQLAHAGRKASTARPWDGGAPVDEAHGGWTPVAPSAIAFAPDYPTPTALTKGDLQQIEHAFRAATARAREAGFKAVEIHAAHGYLLHEFLSPLSNTRTDEYGGSFANRTRFLLQVTDAVRAEWPGRLPLIVRISTTDWADGGWTVDASVELCRQLKVHGVDLVDCSSAGLVPHARVPVGPGYQVPAAARVRAEAQVPVIAVGLITSAPQAEAIVAEGKADMVAMARQELRDPYFALHAAQELDVELPWPPQYGRARN